VTLTMAARLVPCPACARHVRVTEGTCPFCRGALASWVGESVAPDPPPKGLARAGLYTYGKTAAAKAAFGAAVLAVAACDSHHAPAPVDSIPAVAPSPGAQAQVSVYGAPPPQPPPQDASSGAVDAGLGQVQIYGSPPPRPAPSLGAAVPAYGAPPPARTAVPPGKP
jgi:hypothetical protein